MSRKWLTRRRIRLTALGGLTFVLVLATACVIGQVFVKLADYGSAPRDNMQWTIAQLEVDHARLLTAATLLTRPGDGAIVGRIDDLQRRFDAVSGRAGTLTNAAPYRDLLAGTGADTQLAQIGAMLDRLTPVMDGDGAGILAARDDIVTALTTISPAIRDLSLTGMRIDAAAADTARKELTSSLVEIAVLSLALLAAFLSLVVFLWRLYVLYRQRALDNRTTLNRLSTILNTSQDAIIVVARDGRIVDFNRAAADAFGLPRKSGAAHVRTILFRKTEDGDPEPVSGARLLGSCADGPNLCADLLTRGADGQFVPVEMSADLAHRSGKPVCVCFLRDISRRLAAQAEIEIARNKAIAGERARARFLGTISHEMRTPLNGVLGALDLLGETRLTGEQKDYTRIMQNSGHLLLNQINDALDITQAETGQLTLNATDFDLDQLLDETLASLSSEAGVKGITLSRSATRIGPVRGDRDRLQQILLNLLSNAVKFTATGAVTLDAARVDSGVGDGVIEVQICDTGIGIAEADLPRVFDDFVRVGPGGAPPVPGTGLGLGIVRHLATMMEGEIGVESIAGQGSLFWVRLPLPPSRAGAAVPAPPDLRPVTPQAILVAEDNATSRFVLTQMLAKDGHDVTEVADGPAAIAAASARRFDLILMDVSMPGLDGIEATRRIRDAAGPSRAARIVLLTARYRPGEDDRLDDTGADAVHAKPVRRAALRAILAGRSVDILGPAPAPVPAPGSGPQLDTEVIDQLGQAFGNDGLSGMLDRFLAEGDAFRHDLPGLTGLAPREAAARLHCFAGSAATFGAMELQSALSQAETAVLAGRSDQLTVERDAIETLWHRTRAEIVSRHKAA